MINYNFAIFILSHGRANNLMTLNTLREKTNYSGKIYIVCDDDDDQLNEYLSLSLAMKTEGVLVFNKEKISKDTDTMDNFQNFGSVIFARNQTWNFAQELGIDYFLELDDDYTDFHFRYVEHTPSGDVLKSKRVQDLDAVINACVEFLENTEKCYCLSFAIAGDFIGGADSKIVRQGFRRRCLNTFFCSTKKKFPWKGLIFEDHIASALQNSIGHIFISIPQIGISQPDHEAQAGGFTDMYKVYGNYHRASYLLMAHPSATEIKLLTYPREYISQVLNEKFYVTKIISDKYKKIKDAE